MKKVFNWIISFIIVIFIIAATITTVLLLCTNDRGVIEFKGYSLAIAKENVLGTNISNNDIVIVEDVMFNKLKVGDVVSYTKNTNNSMPDIKIGKISNIGRNSSTQLSLIIKNSDGSYDEVSEGNYVGKWENKKIAFFGIIFSVLLTKSGFLLGVILPLILLLVYEITKIVIIFKTSDSSEEDIIEDNNDTSSEDIDIISSDNDLSINSNDSVVVLEEDSSVSTDLEKDSTIVADDEVIGDDSSLVKNDDLTENNDIDKDEDKDDDVEVL